MHPNPIIGLGWDQSFLKRLEVEYRIFFTMHAAFPEVWLPPSRPLDLFWHEHLLDTRAYFADCDQVAGHYLHHLPYFGMRDEADISLCLAAFQAERQLYLQCVGQEPPRDLWAVDCTEERIRSLVAGCFIAVEEPVRHG
ncbi:MAG: glycine-rich domain-containing protein [Synechococcaceae cyanobacterium]